MKKQTIKPMNVNRELEKFCKLHKKNQAYSWYRIVKNGLGEPLRVEFGDGRTGKTYTAHNNDTMKIKFKAKKVHTGGSWSRELWGENYRFITVYEQGGEIVVDTSKSLYMAENRGELSESEAMKQHQIHRGLEAIEDQREILRLKEIELRNSLTPIYK